MKIDLLCKIAPMCAVINDDQQVEIAVRSDFAARRRAEENDPLGLRDLDDAPNDLRQLIQVGARAGGSRFHY